MIDKKQLFDGNGEFGRTERIHLTMLTEADKDIYLSSRYPGKYKVATVLEDWFETIWEVGNSKSVLTFCIWNNILNTYVGYCNYNSLDKDVAAIGIELIDEYQNKGLGYEICSLLLEKFFERTEEPYIHYEVQRSNERSRHLCEKLGGILLEVNPLSPKLDELNAGLPEEKRIDCRALDIFTYAIYRPEKRNKSFATDGCI